MIILILLCCLVILAQCSTIRGKHEARYECGPHGKFEYCIDGIPGCVVGCHCHPGYYFDTDSKICEPNVKLTQNYRRRYLSEPTRVYEYLHPLLTPTATEPLPPVTTDRLDDAISKDTDDLGDWLYNQFFKTIESQVINNTNTDNKAKGKPQLTRRSGGDADAEVFKKPKRKARKSMRSEKKRKHSKVHGLRRKLLRITEDDSLFQSDSDSEEETSDSDYSDESSGESSSGESDSDTSPETKPDKQTDSAGDDKDHGHKKVIIFNRRPKPPLPSFIFLPGMDSPFYPPIGLPPPPPLPMFPMVPVPPMAPPFFFPDPPCATNGTTSTTPAATTIPTNTTTTNSTEPKLPEETKQPNITTKLRSKKLIARNNEAGKHQKLKNSQRNKLMQKLLEKMQETKHNEEAADEPQGDEVPLVDDFTGTGLTQEVVASHGRRQKKKEKLPNLEDVDFKYLSELIHRVNQSQDMNKPLIAQEPPTDIQNVVQPPMPSRRFYNSYASPPLVPPLPPRNLHNNMRSDDLYYTNLGRQIASMIRNADSKINQPVINYPSQAQYPSVLNQHNNVPRNYWERSVRSPLPQMGKSMDYLEDARPFIKQSTEKKLYNIENEVETIARTSKPLSLQDLENILNAMQRAHIHITFDDHEEKTRENKKQPSNRSFNVNLLANYDKIEPYRRLLNPPDVEYAEVPKSYIEYPKTNETNTKQNEIVVQQPHLKQQDENDNLMFDYWMYESPKRQVTATPAITTVTPNTTIAPYTQRYTKSRTKPTYLPRQNMKTNMPNMHAVKTLVPQAIIVQQQVKKPQVPYAQYVRNMQQPSIQQNAQNWPQHNLVSRPPDNMVNYKSVKYFTGNKNKYVFEAASYPIQISSFRRTASKPLKRKSPSYFHHELHHFDYFD